MLTKNLEIETAMRILEEITILRDKLEMIKEKINKKMSHQKLKQKHLSTELKNKETK